MAGRVAIASSDGNNIDLHFAKASNFYIYDLSDSGYQFIENRKLTSQPQGHNENEFEKILTLLEDCKAILVSQIGKGALGYVSSKGIRVFEAPYPIDRVLEKFLQKSILDND